MDGWKMKFLLKWSIFRGYICLQAFIFSNDIHIFSAFPELFLRSSVKRFLPRSWNSSKSKAHTIDPAKPRLLNSKFHRDKLVTAQIMGLVTTVGICGMQILSGFAAPLTLEYNSGWVMQGVYFLGWKFGKHTFTLACCQRETHTHTHQMGWCKYGFKRKTTLLTC